MSDFRIDWALDWDLEPPTAQDPLGCAVLSSANRSIVFNCFDIGTLLWALTEIAVSLKRGDTRGEAEIYMPRPLAFEVRKSGIRVSFDGLAVLCPTVIDFINVLRPAVARFVDCFGTESSLTIELLCKWLDENSQAKPDRARAKRRAPTVQAWSIEILTPLRSLEVQFGVTPGTNRVARVEPIDGDVATSALVSARLLSGKSVQILFDAPIPGRATMRFATIGGCFLAAWHRDIIIVDENTFQIKERWIAPWPIANILAVDATKLIVDYKVGLACFSSDGLADWETNFTEVIVDATLDGEFLIIDFGRKRRWRLDARSGRTLTRLA
ncbi:MAG: hypothetical protein HUU60_12855 [Armatimonadetes bacterium]|nr:hypothetical protein [Armatimonadota bacterium]